MSKPTTPRPVTEKRSAPRTAKPIDIVLRCPDKSGKSFVEKTRTVDISRTGAKTVTEHDVSNGTRLQMAIPHLKRMSWATVARLGNTTGKLQELGVAIDETNNFWGVQLPEEMQAPPAAGTVPQQVGTEPEAKTVATETNPSLALVEQLLSSTKLNQEISSAPAEAGDAAVEILFHVLREEARSAIEQSVGEARQQLHEQAEEILKNLQEVLTQQTEDRLRRCVEAALQQRKQRP